MLREWKFLLLFMHKGDSAMQSRKKYKAPQITCITSMYRVSYDPSFKNHLSYLVHSLDLLLWINFYKCEILLYSSKEMNFVVVRRNSVGFT